MKIIRDGKEYELTGMELYAAYRECKRSCFAEDVRTKAEEMGIELTDEEANELADVAEDSLNNCDSFWEDYWMAIESALEQK